MFNTKWFSQWMTIKEEYIYQNDKSFPNLNIYATWKLITGSTVIYVQI